MTRSRAKSLETIETSMGEYHDQNEDVSQEGLLILVHIEKYEGGPVYSTFLQKEIVREIINGCVRYCVPEFPHSSATLNIITGSHIQAFFWKSYKGSLGDSTCPTQCKSTISNASQ